MKNIIIICILTLVLVSGCKETNYRACTIDEMQNDTEGTCALIKNTNPSQSFDVVVEEVEGYIEEIK